MSEAPPGMEEHENELIKAVEFGEQNLPPDNVWNEGRAKAKETSTFKFKSLKSIISELKGSQYLIKPFIQKDTTIVLFGESGAYKSFVALDFALCVAYGVDYHGRKVHEGAVFYICGEGHGGIGRRIEAWRIHNKVNGDAPFYLSEMPAQLFEDGNAEAIKQEIDRLCENHEAPALIVIDTLSTNFGNGNESDNGDVAAFITKVNAHIRQPYEAAALIVHHVGHGAKDRERGAYAIRANADSRILIAKQTGYRCSMECKKMKDDIEFEPVAFKTIPVIIPDLKDSEGEEVTSLALDMIEYISEGEEKKLPEKQGQAFAVLSDMYKSYGERLESQGRDKSEAKVESAHWLDKCQELKIIAPNRNSRSNIKKSLLDKKVIREERPFIYISAMNEGQDNE